MNSLQYWNGWERRRGNVEKRWMGKVKSALMHQAREAARHVRSGGIVGTRSNLSQIVHYAEIGKVIKALYIQSGLYQANVVYGDLRRVKYAGFGFNEKWTDEIKRFFELNLLNKAVLPITETSKRIIRKILDQAISEGWSAEQTADEIVKQCEDINARRALVITRTETVRAMNVGTLIGAEESRLLLDKMWITARDERVRNSHRRLQGKTIEIEDIFPNGCAFPGDPNGSAKETINCRCTIALVPRRDSNGRPIRKPGGIRIRDNRQEVNQVITEGLATILDELVQ